MITYLIVFLKNPGIPGRECYKDTFRFEKEEDKLNYQKYIFFYFKILSHFFSSLIYIKQVIKLINNEIIYENKKLPKRQKNGILFFPMHFPVQGQ